MAKILARISLSLIIITSTLQVAVAWSESGHPRYPQAKDESGTFAEYMLTIEAENGYIIKQPNQESYPEGQTVRLISRPATGYRFSHWEGDADGQRLIADVVMTGNKTVQAVFEAWTPPIGIPAPEFGIFETYRMYDEPATRNPTLTYTRNAEGGYYTHYVNPTDSNATDSDNPFGTINKPRVTLPKATDVPEGSVIEIGGDTTIAGQLIYRISGTAERPIFLRGNDPAHHVKLTGGDFHLTSQYLIMENISRPDESITVRAFKDGIIVHHVAVRNSTLWRVTALSYDGGTTEDVVFYGNDVNGHAFDPESGEIPESDNLGGIGIGSNSNRIWIVDNAITLAGGDAVGAGHAANYTARNYYVGRNTMHTCGENAVDIKEVENIIISQNMMYDFQGWSAGSGGGGTAIVAHYGPTYSPKNVWILFNEIFDANDKGIQVGGDQRYDVYIIGNLIHDIHDEEGSGVGYETWNSEKVFVIGNVFYDLDNGLKHSTGHETSQLILHNNIIANVSPTGFHLLVADSVQRTNAEISHNIFYQPDADARIVWDSNDYNVDEFQAATDKCQGCLEADPLFTNAVNNDFHIQPNSPARDAGTSSTLYQQFDDFFGQNISVDYDGIPRPQGKDWDIGPYELVPSLILHGSPGDQTIYLNWTLNTTSNFTGTWHIDYYTTPTPIYSTDISSSTARSTTLTDHIQNYQWYTVTLNAMLDDTTWLSDTVRVMPTDQLLYLPLVQR